MADVTYRVELLLSMASAQGASQQMGGLSSKAKEADTSFAKLGETVGRVGSSMSGAITGAIEHVGALAMRFGMLAGGAAIGAAIAGVTKLNSGLENSQIGIASILRANGQAGSFPDAMQLSADIMKDIRQDAKALPGEVKDLVNIFQSIAIPGFQAGADSSHLRQMAAQMMAFGIGVAHLPAEVVGREAAMLMEGRAGAHNVLGMKLAGLGGDKAQAFNQMSATERMQVLTEKLSTHGEAIAVFSKSYEGLSSTLTDNIKGFVRLATEPLFERVKATLSSVNQWFDNNEGYVQSWAAKIGEYLVQAFDMGKQAILDWYPAVRTFAVDAFREIAGIWERVGPTIKSLAEALKDSLADGSAISRIESIAKMYAVLKIGTPVLGAGTQLGGMLGPMMGESAAAGPLGIAAMAAAALIAGGALHALADSTSEYHEAATASASRLQTQFDILAQRAEVHVIPALDAVGAGALEFYANAFTFWNTVFDTLGDPLGKLAASLDEAAGSAGLLTRLLNESRPNSLLAKSEAEDNAELAADVAARRSFTPGSGLFAFHVGAAAEKNLKPGAGGGGGGTHVQKVEIVVNQNDDPMRVAEHVVAIVQNINRHPRVARARNFSR